MLWFDSRANMKGRITLFFAGIMADVGLSIEEESHPKYLENNEDGNIRDGEI